MAMLVRQPGGAWHEPATSAYENERSLQDLVKLSPNLLPGDDLIAVADELVIPGVGRADLVGVDGGGRITIVECKLRANPQIRREVVGQVLAYAGAIWQMGADDFCSAFAAAAGRSVGDAVRAATGEDIDDETLRSDIGQHLAAGDFRLIVVVDLITAELKTIIEFLNSHTVGQVEVLALELDYAQDGDVEVLVPTVYGLEAAQRPAAASSAGSSNWDMVTMRGWAENALSGGTREAILRLLDHGAQRGVDVGVGHAASPGMTCYYSVSGERTQVWVLRGGKEQLRMYRGVLVARTPERWERFEAHLRSHQDLAPLIGAGTQPGMGLEPLGAPGAVDHLLLGLDLLIDEPVPVNDPTDE